MDIAYTRDEMVAIEELQENLDLYIDKLQDTSLEKLLIIKDDIPSCVLISDSEYKKFKLFEEIYNSIDKK